MQVIESNEISEIGQRTLNGLQRAVTAALERKQRLGQYWIVWRDGRVQRVEPDAGPQPRPTR